MSEELFDVVFFGILQTGKDKDTVMQNMATLFKTNAEKIAPYFAGGRKVIKAKVNAVAAEKYKSALENVGLVVTLEAYAGPAAVENENQSATPAESTENQSDKNQSAAKTETASNEASSITIAPVGADVLEHPVVKPAQKIADISDITLAEAGADVIEHPIEKTAQEIGDISNLSMAEVGSDVLDHPREVTAPEIADISDISLAEAGADLIENPKPKEKAPTPDISELTLD